MNYALHHYSHWQGAGRGSRIDVFATCEEAEAIQNRLSTCSFCFPGRTAQYSTGTCFEVVPTRHPVTASVDVDDDVSINDYVESMNE